MTYSKIDDLFFVFKQKSAASLSAAYRFRPSRYYFFLAFLLQLAAWSAAVMIYRQLSGSSLVLHYNVSGGIDLIGDPSEIFFYPVYGLLAFIFNFVISLFFSRRSDFHKFSHLLASGAVFFNVCLLLAIFFIYLINFR